MSHISPKLNMLITKLKVSFPNYSSYVLFILIMPVYDQLHSWNLGSMRNIPLSLILPSNQSRMKIERMSKKAWGDMWFLVKLSDQGLNKAWSVPDIWLPEVINTTSLLDSWPFIPCLVYHKHWYCWYFLSPGFNTILTLFSSFFSPSFYSFGMLILLQATRCWHSTKIAP